MMSQLVMLARNSGLGSHSKKLLKQQYKKLYTILLLLLLEMLFLSLRWKGGYKNLKPTY